MKFIIKNIEETYKIRNENITIHSLAKFNADTNEQVFDEKLDDDAINQAFDVYRAKHNLISPDRIKTLRKTYGLNQKDFANLLGFKPLKLAIYETGSLISEIDNLILSNLEKSPQIINEYYQLRKQYLSKKGREVIKNFLN